MKTVMIFAASVAIAISAGSAHAGGWGKKGGSNSLVSVGGVGVNVLNGGSLVNGSILGGNAILSGNIVSGILNGNKTAVGNGILSGGVLGILSGNSYRAKKGR